MRAIALRGVTLIHSFDPQILSTPFGSLYWYGAVYTFGFIGVFLWFRFRRHAIGLSDRDVVNFIIVFAAGVLVGGRVFDILVYEADFYRARPLAALNWWNGGMASHGILLGGLIATWAFARRRGISVLVLLDEIVVPGALLLAVGRIGNFIEGGVIGSATSMPWGFIYEDVENPRHPVALYESAKNILLIPILVMAIRRWPPGKGMVVSIFVILYAALRFAVDLYRDYEASWLGLGTGQVFNLAMAASGVALLLLFIKFPPRIVRPKPTQSQHAGLIRVLILFFIILYPLGIPTSWTQENIVAKRGESASPPVD